METQINESNWLEDNGNPPSKGSNILPTALEKERSEDRNESARASFRTSNKESPSWKVSSWIAKRVELSKEDEYNDANYHLISHKIRTITVYLQGRALLVVNERPGKHDMGS